MKTPIFSIIIPAYNVAKHIEQTLLSVYKQTVEDFEILVIDDGSTDGTDEILKSQTDSRLRVIRQQNSGVSVARNRGIHKARGEFIAFLDGDDIWACNHLEIALKFFTEFPEYHWFYTSQKMTYDIDTQAAEEGVRGEVTYKAVNWFLYTNRDVISSCCVIRKSAIHSDELFPLGVKMYEDNVAWSRIAMRYPMIGTINRPTVQYRMRQQSASQSYAVSRLGRDSDYNGAFLHHQDLYISPDCSREAKLFFRFYSLLNWWGRIRSSSLISWKDEIRHRRALNGGFITAWLLAGASLNHFFCLCYAKIIRLQLNAVVREMERLLPDNVKVLTTCHF